MAKRRRLTPAQSGFLDSPGPEAPETGSQRNSLRPPIAQAAGDASVVAAFEEVASALATARDEGRLIQSLPLDQIIVDYLVRDRVAGDAEEMDALKLSLKARGQQTPIEVVRVAAGAGAGGPPRYGLISGWRRLQALQALSDETGDKRFGQILVLTRAPSVQSEAYVAMVEENEIRANLSFFERARVALRALEAGAFESDKHALQSLFASASYAKRSKIKSFMVVVAALDGALRFPTQLNERNGLALAKALEQRPGLAQSLRAALDAADPQTPEAETKLLRSALSDRGIKRPDTAPGDLSTEGGEEVAPGVHLVFADGRIGISGQKVDAALHQDLAQWLQARLSD